MKIGSIKFANLSESQVKFLPCKIDFDGEVTTQGYLPDSNEGSVFGRKIQGKDLIIPENFKGLLAEGGTDLRVTGSFSQVKYWNWDKEPGESDQLPGLLNHMKVMKSLADS